MCLRTNISVKCQFSTCASNGHSRYIFWAAFHNSLSCIDIHITANVPCAMIEQAFVCNVHFFDTGIIPTLTSRWMQPSHTGMICVIAEGLCMMMLIACVLRPRTWSSWQGPSVSCRCWPRLESFDWIHSDSPDPDMLCSCSQPCCKCVFIDHAWSLEALKVLTITITHL